MGDESSGFLGRLFKKPGKHAPTDEPDPNILPVSKTTVGLCFDFSRGPGFESIELSDSGLQHVLACLKSRKLTGTFFCPAKLCETSPRSLDLIARDGHEVGCLGFWDEKPNELTDEALAQMVLGCRNAFMRR